jgi:hypothetical protein
MSLLLGEWVYGQSRILKLAVPAMRQQVSARNRGVKRKIGPRWDAMPVHIDREAMLAASAGLSTVTNNYDQRRVSPPSGP